MSTAAPLKKTTLPVKHSCGGNLISSNGAFSCAGCGKEWVTNSEKHEFYKLYRDDILAAVRQTFPNQVSKDWGIPPSTLSQLIKGRYKDLTAAVERTPAPPQNHPLPQLPYFDASWTEAVQLRWLDVWQSLHSKGNQEAR